MNARYAIYFMPSPVTSVWRFGSSAIGYDAQSQLCVPLPDHHIFREPAANKHVSEPARYGFHATLKAPFTLADGVTEGQLTAEARMFAAKRERFIVPPLAVAAIGQFIALVPATPNTRLDNLAAACVRAFEPMRASLSEADIARRMASPLTSRQIEHLQRWGYPYVFEDFRFHMTLTGSLDGEQRMRFLGALRSLYAPVAAPLAIDAITIARQPDRGSRFVVLARFPFKGAED